jgi:hypothetical protein
MLATIISVIGLVLMVILASPIIVADCIGTVVFDIFKPYLPHIYKEDHDLIKYFLSMYIGYVMYKCCTKIKYEKSTVLAIIVLSAVFACVFSKFI